jgi:uncharacterized protein YjbI with pentapeptide repeats
VTFAYARFLFATFDFGDAKFMGRAGFSSARFSGGIVVFDGSQFTGTVDFSRIVVSDGRLGFRYASFTEDYLHFTRSEFSGGAVLFEGCRFAPGTTARFTNSSFTGAFVDFSYADFQSATLDFIDADWEHPPHFDDFPDDRRRACASLTTRSEARPHARTATTVRRTMRRAAAGA